MDFCAQKGAGPKQLRIQIKFKLQAMHTKLQKWIKHLGI